MFQDLYLYITNMPSWQLLLGFFIAYLGYYFMQVVKVCCFYTLIINN